MYSSISMFNKLKVKEEVKSHVAGLEKGKWMWYFREIRKTKEKGGGGWVVENSNEARKLC